MSREKVLPLQSATLLQLRQCSENDWGKQRERAMVGAFASSTSRVKRRQLMTTTDP